MRWADITAWALAGAMCLTVGCDDDGDEGGEAGAGGEVGGAGGEIGGAGGEIGGAGGVALPAPGEWAAIEPGGDTICSRGTPYQFFVRGGDPSKLIVDFQGGGACWDEFTCSVADAIFSDSVRPLDELERLMAEGQLGGLFDPSPDNPFHDWTIVHVPYCTGDIHWGDAVKSYNEDITINHKGFVNARAALDWIQARVTAPDNVMVSGCSAGAYGAILHSAYIADHYQGAEVAVVADAGGGIITDTFLNDSLPNWGAEANLPPFVEGLQRPLTELSIEDVYVSIAGTFPQHRFAQLSTLYDNDQIFFYTAMGGEAEAWPGLYQQSLQTIAEAAPNFRYYLAEGPMHCALPYPFMHERATDGVPLTGWVSDLATAEAAPDSVMCQGDACLMDPICDACAEDDSAIWCRFCRSWGD